MDYAMIFKVEHGVTSGLGIIDSDATCEKRLQIQENSSYEALKQAVVYAKELARDYLAKRDGNKIVTLQSFKDSSGEEVDQVRLVREAHAAQNPESHSLDSALKDFFPEGKLVIRRPAILDLLEINAE